MQVQVSGDQDLEFDLSSAPQELDEPSILNAPLFEAAVGRSIALESLNSPDHDFDPFLTPDARTIYFASNRGGVRGVYMASRPTPYHDFAEPELIQASSGSDQPVSPSVTADGLLLIYAVPEKARLWQLTRSGVDAPFGNKEIARGDEQAERTWQSAQVSSDGLRLYWTEEGDEAIVTRAAVRSSPGRLFGKTLEFELPGYHPHLSSDGLRQFTFDGTTLMRARRGNIRQAFGSPETIADLQLEKFPDEAQHRQFWVTEDEQWLFFCDSPKSSGNLFVVRLADGAAWGRTFVGTSIEDKMAAAPSVADVKPKPEKPAGPDPRTLPLPYTTHWSELVKLLEANQPDKAIAQVRQSMQDPRMRDDRSLLGWDLELAEAFQQFQQDVQRGLESLKEGDTIRVSGTRFELVRYRAPQLDLKLKDKDITRTIDDLTPGDLIAVADGPEKAEGKKALRFAEFLYFQGKQHHSVAEGWLKRAGEDGKQFYERLAARLLVQGTEELKRGKIAEAIAFLDSAAEQGAETDVAKQANEQKETLYDSIQWMPVGSRKWERGPQGEFMTGTDRANDSYMKSEQRFTDFELSCEWKVEGEAALGGIFFRCSGQGKPLDSGVKIHLANDSELTRMDRFATGALFAITAASQNASHPAGEWNTLKMQVRGLEVKVWINQKEVLQTTLDKAIPDSGFVMLDGVAGGISYRKVLVYELLPAAAPGPDAK